MAEITNPYLSDHTGPEIDNSVNETQRLPQTISAAIAPLATKIATVESNVSSTLETFSTEQQQKIDDFQESINEQIAEQDANIKQQIEEQNENVDNKLKDTDEQLATLGREENNIKYAAGIELDFPFNGYLETNGVKKEYTSTFCTDFIKVNKDDLILYSGFIADSLACICGYSNAVESSFVSVILGGGLHNGDKVVIPSNVKYIRVCGRDEGSVKLMCQKKNGEGIKNAWLTGVNYDSKAKSLYFLGLFWISQDGRYDSVQVDKTYTFNTTGGLFLNNKSKTLNFVAYGGELTQDDICLLYYNASSGIYYGELSSSIIAASISGVKSFPEYYEENTGSYAFANKGYLNSNGAFIEYGLTACTDFIEVQSGQPLMFSGRIGEGNACVCGYNSAKTFVSIIIGTGNHTDERVIVPDNIKFIRACSSTDVPFYFFYEGFFRNYETLNQKLKNIEADVDFTESGYLQSNGSVTYGNDWALTDYIMVAHNSKVRFSGRMGAAYPCICGYSKSMQFVSILLQGAGSTIYVDKVVSIPETVDYIRLCSAKDSQYSATINYKGALGNYLVNEYYGKKLNWIGDSIVQDFDFDDIVADYFGMTLNDYGINGSTIASNGTSARDPISLRFAQMGDADVIGVSAGTNDFQYNWTDIGTISDTTVNTFYGALNVLCKGLIDKYPTKLIFFTTPIKRAQEPYMLPTSQNEKGLTLKQYGDIIKEVCAMYSIPVLDMWSESLLNPHLASQASMFDEVGTHPDDTGKAIMARRVRGFLKQLM